jgi:hypothetical protein
VQPDHSSMWRYRTMYESVFHCVSFSLDCPWLPDQILSEPLVLLSTLFSILLRFPPGGVPLGMKTSVPRVLIHLPHGYVSYVTWPISQRYFCLVRPNWGCEN